MSSKKDISEISESERREMYVRLREHMKRTPSKPALSGRAHAEMLIQSDLMLPQTCRAVVRASVLAVGKGRRRGRPTLTEIRAAAKECGARVEAVAACWGFAPGRHDRGWVDLSHADDGGRLGWVGDSESLAGVLIFSILHAPIRAGFLFPKLKDRPDH